MFLKIHAYVSFGVILRNRGVRDEPRLFWTYGSSSNKSVLWRTLHRRETRGFRDETSYFILRIALMQSSDQIQPIGVILLVLLCGSEWLWVVSQRPIGLILRTLVCGSDGTPFLGIRDSGIQDTARSLCPSEKFFLFCDYSITDITQKVNRFWKIIYQIVILHEIKTKLLCIIYKSCHLFGNQSSSL